MQDLTCLGRNIWIVNGPDVRDAGLLFTTRMTIIKLTDGSVWVESPVTLPAEVMAHIDSIGPVRYIVASTQRHVWRLNAWHDMYPDAQLWAPAGAPLTVGTIEAPVNDVFTDTPAEGWAADLEQVAFKGSLVLREVLFFHRDSGTVIAGDIIQINPMIKGRPIRNLIFRVLGAGYPKGGVSFDIKMSFRNRALARQSLEKLLSWDFDKLVIAHGECIETNAKAYVQQAFRWLSSPS